MDEEHSEEHTTLKRSLLPDTIRAVIDHVTLLLIVQFGMMSLLSIRNIMCALIAGCHQNEPREIAFAVSI